MGTRILVVDDDPSVRESIGLILAERGYLIETAESGQQALAIWKPKRFDLIITDLRMPAMNGQELLAQVRAIDPTQRVMLVSAFPSAAAAALFDGVLTKPFSARDLLARVTAALLVHQSSEP